MTTNPDGTTTVPRTAPTAFIAAATGVLLVAATASAEPAALVRGNVRIVNAIVASIDGKPITLREFSAYQNGRGRLLPPDQRKSESEFLDGMIEEQLLRAEFATQQIRADDEDTQYYIDRILDANGSTKADVERALSEIGLHWADYFERMRFEVEKLALINREIRARVHVTNEEVERYWLESGGANEPEGYDVSQIFIPIPPSEDPAQAEAVKQRVQEAYAMIESDGFARAAKKYSFGPTAADGGKIGKFEKGQLAPEFEQRLSELSPGEYTKPFIAGGGIHILKLDRVIAGGARRQLTDERREQIRNKLYDDMLDERLQRWVREDLRKKHHVAVRLQGLGRLLGRESESGPPATGEAET
jgi:peptidyl-prolyl cis-trans isomerase SurA